MQFYVFDANFFGYQIRCDNGIMFNYKSVPILGNAC